MQLFSAFHKDGILCKTVWTTNAGTKIVLINIRSLKVTHSSLIIFQFLQYHRWAVARYQVSAIINISLFLCVISCYMNIKNKGKKKWFKVITETFTPNIVTFSFWLVIFSTLCTNVERSICKSPTGCFLNHFPTEATLQIFTDISRFFFRPRKPEGPDLSSAQKHHLVFHL